MIKFNSRGGLVRYALASMLMMFAIETVHAEEVISNPSRRHEVISAIYRAQEFISAPKPLTVERLTGEVIRYSIKQGPLRIGTAKLAFKGFVTGESGDSTLIHVTWKIPGFSSDEHIFVDPQTFHPRFVYKERNKFGCKIRILEDYFPEHGRVAITRDTCGNETQQITADRGGPVENIYAMIYQLRMRETAVDLVPPFAVRMPDKDENFRLEGVKKLNVGRKKYQARHFASETFGIWMEPGDERIPLRIDSAEEVSVTMVMKSRAFSEDADKEDDDAEEDEGGEEDEDETQADDDVSFHTTAALPDEGREAANQVIQD